MKYSQLLAIGCALLLGCGVKQPSAVAPKQDASVEPTMSQVVDVPARQDRDSPAKVHAAYIAAMERKEWEKAFDCLTPDRQDMEILGLFFGLAMNESKTAERHLDEKQFRELTAALDEERGDEQMMSAVLKTVKDKRAFYLEATAELAEEMKRELPHGPLRNVTVRGDHASGVVTMEMDGPMVGEPGKEPRQEPKVEYEEEIPFTKGPNGWLIDAPRGSFPKVGRK